MILPISLQAVCTSRDYVFKCKHRNQPLVGFPQAAHIPSLSSRRRTTFGPCPGMPWGAVATNGKRVVIGAPRECTAQLIEKSASGWDDRTPLWPSTPEFDQFVVLSPCATWYACSRGYSAYTNVTMNGTYSSAR